MSRVLPLFDLAEGVAARDEGVQRVAANSLGFVQLMRGVAFDLCVVNGTVSIDELRRWAHYRGISPHHPNAWGAVFRSKTFEPVGRRQSAWVSNHARSVQVYKLRGTRGDQ